MKPLLLALCLATRRNARSSLLEFESPYSAAFAPGLTRLRRRVGLEAGENSV